MQVEDKAEVAPLTTMRVGGTVDRLITPATEAELVEAWKRARDEGPLCVLGRGSNTIFDDGLHPGSVIRTVQACKETTCCRESRRLAGGGAWEVHAGAGVTLQAFVDFCARHRIEAPAYLCSVPGNIGGSIVMNAGTGVREGRCISENLSRVKVFDGQTVTYIDRDDCAFAFRDSAFQRKDWLVLGAVFRMPSCPERRTRTLMRKRMDLVRKTQDSSSPNAGSVFKTGFRDFPEIRGHRSGDAMFSHMTANWIVNLGSATAQDVRRLVDYARAVHADNGLEEPVLEIHIKTSSRPG